MSVNVVSLTGNITQDAKLNQTHTNGTAVLNFSIAVTDRRRNNQTGEWEDHPNFIDITVFGKRAETIAGWCKKGTKVAIQGKLRQNTWQDKETGQNRSRITVICDEIDFMQRRSDNGGGGGYNGGGYSGGNGGGYSAPTPVQNTAPAAEMDDEDVPF